MSTHYSAFDASSADAQGSAVSPLSVAAFDVAAYADYASRLDESCATFAASDSGLLVHRRFRIPEVFSHACSDMKTSLEAQLGALQASMTFPMDVPNFLEPWFGIGALATAFGAEYLWPPGAAPATEGLFEDIDEALAVEPRPIAETPVGRHTLEMVEYFLEATGGRVPMSCSDVQSPLNAAVSLFDTATFFTALMDEPEKVVELLDRIVALEVAFFEKQIAVIGPALVRPGHGFASSRRSRGFGASDDNAVMLSPAMYREIFAPALMKMGNTLGGTVFHSCGNWGRLLPTILGMEGLVAVDAALTPATDPDPNDPALFGETVAGTGVILNARMVGPPSDVVAASGAMRKPGLKTIVVTYCASPEEQGQVYAALKEGAL